MSWRRKFVIKGKLLPNARHRYTILTTSITLLLLLSPTTTAIANINGEQRGVGETGSTVAVNVNFSSAKYLQQLHSNVYNKSKVISNKSDDTTTATTTNALRKLIMNERKVTAGREEIKVDAVRNVSGVTMLVQEQQQKTQQQRPLSKLSLMPIVAELAAAQQQIYNEVESTTLTLPTNGNYRLIAGTNMISNNDHNNNNNIDKKQEEGSNNKNDTIWSQKIYKQPQRMQDQKEFDRLEHQVVAMRWPQQQKIALTNTMILNASERDKYNKKYEYSDVEAGSETEESEKLEMFHNNSSKVAFSLPMTIISTMTTTMKIGKPKKAVGTNNNNSNANIISAVGYVANKFADVENENKQMLQFFMATTNETMQNVKEVFLEPNQLQGVRIIKDNEKSVKSKYKTTKIESGYHVETKRVASGNSKSSIKSTSSATTIDNLSSNGANTEQQKCIEGVQGNVNLPKSVKNWPLGENAWQRQSTKTTKNRLMPPKDDFKSNPYSNNEIDQKIKHDLTALKNKFTHTRQTTHKQSSGELQTPASANEREVKVLQALNMPLESNKAAAQYIYRLFSSAEDEQLRGQPQQPQQSISNNKPSQQTKNLESTMYKECAKKICEESQMSVEQPQHELHEEQQQSKYAEKQSDLLPQLKVEYKSKDLLVNNNNAATQSQYFEQSKVLLNANTSTMPKDGHKSSEMLTNVDLRAEASELKHIKEQRNVRKIRLTQVEKNQKNLIELNNMVEGEDKEQREEGKDLELSKNNIGAKNSFKEYKLSHKIQDDSNNSTTNSAEVNKSLIVTKVNVLSKHKTNANSTNNEQRKAEMTKKRQSALKYANKRDDDISELRQANELGDEKNRESLGTQKENKKQLEKEKYLINTLKCVAGADMQNPSQIQDQVNKSKKMQAIHFINTKTVVRVADENKSNTNNYTNTIQLNKQATEFNGQQQNSHKFNANVTKNVNDVENALATHAMEKTNFSAEIIRQRSKHETATLTEEAKIVSASANKMKLVANVLQNEFSADNAGNISTTNIQVANICTLTACDDVKVSDINVDDAEVENAAASNITKKNLENLEQIEMMDVQRKKSRAENNWIHTNLPLPPLADVERAEGETVADWQQRQQLAAVYIRRPDMRTGEALKLNEKLLTDYEKESKVGEEEEEEKEAILRQINTEQVKLAETLEGQMQNVGERLLNETRNETDRLINTTQKEQQLDEKQIMEFTKESDNEWNVLTADAPLVPGTKNEHEHFTQSPAQSSTFTTHNNTMGKGFTTTANSTAATILKDATKNTRTFMTEHELKTNENNLLSVWPSTKPTIVVHQQNVEQAANTTTNNTKYTSNNAKYNSAEIARGNDYKADKAVTMLAAMMTLTSTNTTKTTTTMDGTATTAAALLSTLMNNRTQSTLKAIKTAYRPENGIQLTGDSSFFVLPNFVALTPPPPTKISTTPATTLPTMTTKEYNLLSGVSMLAYTTIATATAIATATTTTPSGALWPVKHASVMEGDVILGGLMMVHSREDSITCGPIMPQGGIQALEAMLYTLDQVNKQQLLPNITLGAHILDDCDKDTYGLEMAVDFIKGKSLYNSTFESNLYV